MDGSWWRWSRGGAVPRVAGLVGAVALTLGAAVAPPSAHAWTISQVQAAQAPNGTLVADSCPAPGTCLAVGSYHVPSGASATLAELQSGSAWKALPTPNPAGGHGSVLTAVSCRSPSACTAVGSYGNGQGTATALAETWNGTGWRIVPTPYPAGSFGSYLTGVSCAAAAACTAVGYYYTQNFEDGPQAFAESWNGTAWTLRQVPDGSLSPMFLYAVSCTSPAVCVAVGSYNGPLGSGLPLAEVWNGTSWTMQAPAVPNGGFAELTGVSCTSATSCTAVGNYSQNQKPFAELALGESWNGTTWAIRGTPDPGGSADLIAVSCTAATACTAVGWALAGLSATRALAEVWDGTAWTAQAAALPAGAAQSTLAGVSCTVAGTCAAAGSGYYDNPGAWHTLAEAQQGAAWAIQATASPRGALGGAATALLLYPPLRGVSCTAATACIAVGSMAASWNGAAWATLALARPAGVSKLMLGSVSCTAASACTAVGSYNDATGAQLPLAESWNGSVWRVEATAEPAGATGAVLTGVSCTAATSCEAVGSYTGASGLGQTLAESWDGATWTLQTTVNSGTRSDGLSGVSCTAASACTAVGFADGQGPLAEGWNGSTWSQQPTPRALPLNSVSCSAASACVAVGDGGLHPEAGTWNGSTWTLRSLPAPTGTQGTFLNGVSCAGPSQCTAVGFYFAGSNGGFEATVAEAWNGTAWTIQPTPKEPFGQIGALYGVSCTAGSACTAVGGSGPMIGDYGVQVPLAERRS